MGGRAQGRDRHLHLSSRISGRPSKPAASIKTDLPIYPLCLGYPACTPYCRGHPVEKGGKVDYTRPWRGNSIILILSRPVRDWLCNSVYSKAERIDPMNNTANNRVQGTLHKVSGPLTRDVGLQI